MSGVEGCRLIAIQCFKNNFQLTAKHSHTVRLTAVDYPNKKLRKLGKLSCRILVVAAILFVVGQSWRNTSASQHSAL